MSNLFSSFAKIIKAIFEDFESREMHQIDSIILRKSANKEVESCGPGEASG